MITSILTILIIILIFIFLGRFIRSRETFDKNTVMFMPKHTNRYDLRGWPICTESIAKAFISPYRQIKLDHTGGNMMWESSYTPAQEGIKDCKKVPCPKNTDEYDKMDTCWYCGSIKKFCKCDHPLLDIPIHSH